MTNKANTIAGLVIGVIAGALGVLLIYFAFGNTLKFASYDLLFALRPIIRPTEALVVYMDEDSHAALNQSFTEPWDRNLHAKLLDHLTAARAKAVVFDIHFSGEGPNPAATTNFARAIRENASVVLGADMTASAGNVRGIGMRRIIQPFEPLADAAADIGSVEVEPSHDLAVRKHLWRPDDVVPSLSQAAASVYSPGLQTAHGDKWINYYGPPGALPHISYQRALEAPPEIFKSKVVFIGARLLTRFAGDRKDEFRSPYALWLKDNVFMPGVEIQATQFLNLIRRDWLVRSNAEPWTVAFIGILAGLALARLRPWTAVAAAIITAIAVVAVSYLSFSSAHVWFPWLIPAAVQLPAALALAVVYQSFCLYLDNKLLEQSLARHLSPVRAKQLLRRRELLQPGAEKQLLSIMFTDIADFTKVSEGMDSAELAKLMNNYFEKAISCVYETDGFLVKLIGDALFAIWNAPIEQPDHTRRVFQTALLLQDRVATFRAPSGIILRTRIGIHTGVADVGNFGSAKRFDYTAIGESINLASRLEGLNKHLGTHILASRDAQTAVADRFQFRCVGRFRFKGFEKVVDVYELLDAPAESQPIFAEALHHFASRNFDLAETAFCRVLKLQPDDGPSRFYLSRLQQLRAYPPSSDWKGEVELLEK